jgi:hypothetical protein
LTQTEFAEKLCHGNICQRYWCSPLLRTSLIQVIHAKFIHHDRHTSASESNEILQTYREICAVVGSSCKRGEARTGWRNLKWILLLRPLSSAGIFRERHEIASPEEIIFYADAPFRSRYRHLFMMLRSPQLRRQATRSFVCWKCIAKSRPVGTFQGKSQRSVVTELSRRHFSGGKTVSSLTSSRILS